MTPRSHEPVTAIPAGLEPGAERIGARRRCLVSGEVADKAALVRFVAAPDGRLVPDLAGRLPGRGLWVGAKRELVDRACRRGHFARAARTKALAMIEPGLSDRIEHLLARRCQRENGRSNDADHAGPKAKARDGTRAAPSHLVP